MSVNRENVIWQSRDGTWNRGFYDFYHTSHPGDEDFDPEWDVEYDYSRFNWVSTGHSTQQEANDAWRGANPGCSEVYSEPSAETDKLDALAKEREKGLTR
jgi:hypothetical protein